MLPHIKVKISDIDFNVKSISELLYRENSRTNTSLPFQDRVFHTFPGLKEKIKEDFSNKEIYNIVEKVIYLEYEKNRKAMLERKVELQKRFDSIFPVILERMIDLFEMNWPEKYKEIACYLGLYAVFPRNVLDKAFWLHYQTPEETVIRASLHEINHFILFEKWKQMHGYTLTRESTHPEVLWFLEEMSVDPTLNSPKLQEVAPYPQRAYEKFYQNSWNGISFEQHIINIFNEKLV